jgi:tyrosine phenol-lyase
MKKLTIWFTSFIGLRTRSGKLLKPRRGGALRTPDFALVKAGDHRLPLQHCGRRCNHHRNSTEDSAMPLRTIIEPFRIKSVEPIHWTTRDERGRRLAAVHYNLFLLGAGDVLIDLLTDSGTGALSTHQRAAVMERNESYAVSRSVTRFKAAVQGIFGYRHVIPTHQKRAAERILFSGRRKKDGVVPNNTHFDTTRANIEAAGAEALDLPIPEGLEPALEHPFKCNMDVGRLEELIQSLGRERAPLVMLTVTNNSGGGQPAILMRLPVIRNPPPVS